MIFKYYGVDWIVFILVVCHLWLLGEKRKLAFVFGAMAAIFGLLFGFLISSVATVIMNVVFFGMHIRGYFKWMS